MKPTKKNTPPERLVNGPRQLELLFEETSRPSMRWLRQQQKANTIPFYKIGHLVYFHPGEVRDALRIPARPQTSGRWNTPTGGPGTQPTLNPEP